LIQNRVRVEFPWSGHAIKIGEQAFKNKADSFKNPVRQPGYAADMAPTFNFIGMVTADLPASLAFYRRLGLDIPADAQGHVDVQLAGGMRLAWDTVKEIQSFAPEWQQPTGLGRVSIAFGCDNPAEVDKLYAELVAAGHPGHREPFDAFWGQRYATVLDPDGNAVDLYAPLT
jgi:catechol 2,3-dioxygenase-like lactoylglutathione lyase family enzyme